MSNGSFELWSDLVFVFIFGYIVKHYLKEVKVRCQKFADIVQECRSQVGLQNIELIVGHSCWKRKKLDWFQLISKQHLEFGSAPFPTDCARSHSLRINHQGDWIVHYFVSDFFQNNSSLSNQSC